jgi:hypothetical protein
METGKMFLLYTRNTKKFTSEGQSHEINGKMRVWGISLGHN